MARIVPLFAFNRTGFKEPVCLIPILLIMLSIGTIIASYANDKMEAAIWETPIFIILITMEIIRESLFNNEWSTFSAMLPNYQYYQGLTLITDQPMEAFLSSFFYFFICAAVFIFLAAFVLNRRQQSF
ncbi:hypothetical protein [Natribacillus halophilus]|uniref:hypothetical protein n=1 Tax=Natribacillus halophilus TaxID=549003 RepID=UPI00115F93D7|nr:hypothetical protein [Natribacillus halophilus]